MTRLPACLAAATLIAMAGCGQIAIKRGSGADALMADRVSCRGQNADVAAVDLCMEQHGWHLASLDPGSAAASAYPSAVTPSAAPVYGRIVPAAPPNLQPAQQTKEVHVRNWLHFGGGPADLHAAAEACVNKLGAVDRPDPGYHTVSMALYACLSAEGWRRMGLPPGV